jgi:hypothetical protein
VVELLTLGGLVTGLAAWGFWLVSLVVFGVFIALTENEHWGWASTLLVSVFGGLWLLGIFNIYRFALEHPGTLFFWIGAYIVTGIVYGAIKWYVFCRKQRKKYNEAKADFMKARHATEFTSELKVEWTEKLRNQDNRYDRYKVVSVEFPKWQDNIEKIINWMYLWPFSIFGMILTDFVREVWEHLCEWMGGVYDSIAKSVWSGVENDLASEEDIQNAREAAAAALQQSNNQRSRSAGGH